MNLKKLALAAVAALSIAGAAEAQVVTPVLQGTAIIAVTPSGGFPATIAANGSWTSGVLPFGGYRGVSATVTSTQAGAITIQRYADAAGTIPVGAVASTTIVASTAETVSVNDGLAALYYKVTITNTSGSTTATITGASITKIGQ